MFPVSGVALPFHSVPPGGRLAPSEASYESRLMAALFQGSATGVGDPIGWRPHRELRLLETRRRGSRWFGPAGRAVVFGLGFRQTSDKTLRSCDEPRTVDRNRDLVLEQYEYPIWPLAID